MGMHNINALSADDPGQPQRRTEVAAVADLKSRRRQADLPAPRLNKSAGTAGKADRSAVSDQRRRYFNRMTLDSSLAFGAGDIQQPQLR